MIYSISLRRLMGLVAVAMLLAVPVMAIAACPTDPSPHPLPVPHLRAALAGGVEGLVVALGSSSTQGAMATDLAHSYPAMLQAALSTALPAAHVAVINRGIGGHIAVEELARLEADVVAIRPQLVIWQVGANGVLKGVNPEDFRRNVTEGVRRMQAAGIDVVLMDNQRTQRLLASPEGGVFDQTLAEVATATGAGLFSRGALMAAWRDGGHPYAEFVAADGLHQNDHGYACVAQSLAHALVAGIGQHALSASR